MFTALIWFALTVVFLLIEGNTVMLVSVWFAAGSLTAMLAALLGAPFWLQLILFLGISAGLLALLRPLVRKYLKPKITATNVDSVVGSQGYVTETVDNLAATGQVKLGAMPWTARSTDGTPIETGTLVRVDRVEGVKAFVSPVRETANI
jgi:membrane protein implicated in regulation of membrane protease activity